MFFCIISVLLPLISFAVTFCLGNRLGFYAKLLTVGNLFTAVLFISIGISEVLRNNVILNVKTHYWLKYASLHIQWGFLFDNVSVLMIFMVCTVSLCVHIYSCYYMAEDPHITRFMAYLSLFTFFMLFLLSSDNLIQIFCAWEGVGLCSYLLINFWFTRIEANKAAIKAVLINRIGDYALFFSIALVLITFKTTELSIINSLLPYFVNQQLYLFGTYFKVIDITCFGFCIAAFCKSAQIGFHIWLPDAMEGPTPVSALIHAATMVTAGVYLILRCSYFFELSPNFLKLLIIVGSLTALLGASTAFFQYDIKKIIAYSTCSQLGYMFVACGLSRYDISLFHLINHGFFKAALFLCAGIIIHTLSGEQDVRKMGGLKKVLPLVYSSMLISSSALAGIPFLSGFYSKDAIMGSLLTLNSSIGFFGYFICLLAALFTSLYSFKILFLVFWIHPNYASRITYLKIHFSGYIPYISVYILTIMSIFSGFYLKDLMVGIGSNAFDGLFCVDMNRDFLIDYEFILYDYNFNSFYKFLLFYVSLFGPFWYTRKWFIYRSNFLSKNIK